MIRREFLEYFSKSLLSLGLGFRFSPAAEVAGRSVSQHAPVRTPAEAVLPGTAPLAPPGDLAEQMEDGIQRFLVQRTQETPQVRTRLGHVTSRSVQDYETSVSL